MTTPRVTVPVEPTPDAYKIAASIAPDLFSDDYETSHRAASPYRIDVKQREKAEQVQAVIDLCRAMLSSAPAPEGGAVPDDVRRLVIAARNVAFDSPTQSELRALDIASEAFASRVPWDDEPEALATREEAPAEAVTADSLRSVSDETMRALLSCKDVGSGRAHLAAIINALRAQPPAREDAQPVAWRMVGPDGGLIGMRSEPYHSGFERMMRADVGCVVQPLYTHPAPDALRVAVEALEPFSEIAGRYLAGGMRADLEARSPSLLDLIEPRDFYRARTALAALQAEQGAK